jgi:hypothetical protein
MKLLVYQIKYFIINFFLNQNKQRKNSAESLIFLLLNSPNDEFCLYVLDQMNKLIMTKEDFYQKGKNERFLLFKLFFEKCGDLYRNANISEGKYLNESYAIKYKIFNEIKKHEVTFDLINNLIDEEEFTKKFESIFSNEGEDPIEILKGLKIDVEVCRVKFSEIEKLNDYFNTFFSNSKKRRNKINK